MRLQNTIFWKNSVSLKALPNDRVYLLKYVFTVCGDVVAPLCVMLRWLPWQQWVWLIRGTMIRGRNKGSIKDTNTDHHKFLQGQRREGQMTQLKVKETFQGCWWIMWRKVIILGWLPHIIYDTAQPNGAFLKHTLHRWTRLMFYCLSSENLTRRTSPGSERKC